MLKAIKKLKNWSKKKKKTRKTLPPQPSSLPAATSTQCCFCSTVCPSAPPLPPWLDYEQTHNTVSGSLVFQASSFNSPSTSEPDRFSPSQVVSDSSPLYSPLPAVSSQQSYQQYMVPNAAYGVPVLDTSQRNGRSGGVLGFVISFGAHFIRCFCPCFCFSEAKC
ncbi:uncharacterized protein LOC113279547 [Papaver somniferum]|uniref:uncharacterized protein LOC113279547 n=1 Tax=Papaver somniferum TaxID=3469 RepID=UPI000E705092|nr:uncharacterized protein LOC113279547 [Papaver somniferum]